MAATGAADASAAATALLALGAAYVLLVPLALLLAAGFLRKCEGKLSLDLFSQRDGLFVKASWPWYLQDLVGTVLIALVAVPLLLVASSLLFGPILAVLERWDVGVGFQFALSEFTGLAGSLAHVSPTSTRGQGFLAALGAFSALLRCAFIGAIAGTPLVASFRRMLRPSVPGLLYFACLVVPLLLGALTAPIGILLSVVEGWPMRDGLLFMLGSLAGLSSPITAAKPATALGMLLAALCGSLEIPIAGLVVGVFAAHPFVVRCFTLLQGCGCRELSRDVRKGVGGGLDSSALRDAAEVRQPEVAAASPAAEEISSTAPSLHLDKEASGAVASEHLAPTTKAATNGPVGDAATCARTASETSTPATRESTVHALHAETAVAEGLAASSPCGQGARDAKSSKDLETQLAEAERQVAAATSLAETLRRRIAAHQTQDAVTIDVGAREDAAAAAQAALTPTKMLSTAEGETAPSAAPRATQRSTLQKIATLLTPPRRRRPDDDPLATLMEEA